MKPFIGCIAVCGSGRIGLITGYNEEKKVWRGVHLQVHERGRDWQSKKPTVLGIAYDNCIEYAKKGTPEWTT